MIKTAHKPLLALMVSSLSCTLVAQEQTTSTASSAFSSAKVLEEVIVTAQRKSESIQEVPIAIKAASEAQLKQAGVFKVQDIAMIDSGVTVTDGFGYVFPFIRGIGSFIPGGAQKSSVGVYVDGVFQSRLQASALELDNIESIEILKGPQATLYGRNATGGTLKIQTKTPMPGDELEGSASVTLGDYDSRRGTFYAASGLSEQLAASFSGYVAKRDGFVENRASDNIVPSAAVYGGQGKANGEDLDNKDSYHINAKLAWQPSADLIAVLSLYKTESDGTASTGLRQLNPNAAATLAFFTGQPEDFFQFGGEHSTYGHANVNRFEGKGGQINIDYDWQDLHFRSVTAFNDVFSENSTDLFATQIPVAGFSGLSYTEDVNQEFQLTESNGEGLDWLLGASYLREESDGDDFTSTLAIQGNMPSISSESNWYIEARSLYAEGYYDLSSDWALTVGVRYAEEEMGVTPTVDPLLSANAPELLNRETSTEEDSTDFRVVLDYGTEWGLVYGSISTGFKAGGIGVNNVAAGAYKPEELTSYEVGVKSTILDGRARLNAAAFVYDFKTIQALIVGGPTGGSSFVITGDQADLAGFEVEFDANLTDRLSVQAGATVIVEKEYSEFEFPGQGNQGDLDFIPSFSASGNDMAGAADVVALLGAQYRQPMPNDASLTLGANINYNSGHYLTLTNDLGTGGLDDGDYTVVNARLSYVTADEDWDVSLWVKNLTDEYYFRAGIVAVGNASIGGLEGQPRHFGVTVKYNF